MKAVKYLLFILLIAIIGVSIYIAVQPNQYSFERSRVISAPPQVLFNKVNDYEAWPNFSPWIEREPNANISFDEKTVGKGAGYSWEGEELGIGSMKTVEYDPYESIEQKLIFVEPFESQADIRWNFEEVDGGTKVTWSMKGEQDFMTKAFTAFMGSIEKSTGPDFERGLFKLDSIVKVEMEQYHIQVNGVVEHSGGFYLYSTTSSRINTSSEKIADILPKVINYAKSNNITTAGSPFILFHEWDEENNATRFSACVPTTARVITTDDDVLTGQLPPFRAMKVTLRGDYKNLQEAWDTANQAIEANSNIEEFEDGPFIEVFVSGPEDSPNPAEWITEIYIAINEI